MIPPDPSGVAQIEKICVRPHSPWLWRLPTYLQTADLLQQGRLFFIAWYLRL